VETSPIEVVDDYCLRLDNTGVISISDLPGFSRYFDVEYPDDDAVMTEDRSEEEDVPMVEIKDSRPVPKTSKASRKGKATATVVQTPTAKTTKATKATKTTKTAKRVPDTAGAKLKRDLQESPSREEAAAKRTRVEQASGSNTVEELGIDLSGMTFVADTAVDPILLPEVRGQVRAYGLLGEISFTDGL
jgi:hypothetical protein